MIYANEKVRRQDRLMTEERALELLRDGEYGVLSMVDENGDAYGIPVNYVWNGDETIYIHCAPEGKKLRSIEKNPIVSFCIIGNVNLLPDKFTTEYESVILKGKAYFNLSDEEKKDAISLLIDKLSSDFKELGNKYAAKSFHRLGMIRVDFSEYSGKCKHVRKS